MATATLADFTVTQSWADVVATLTGAASADAIYQNIGKTPIKIVFGGGSAPAANVSGILLGPLDSIQGNAANVWAKGVAGGVLSVATV